MYSVLIVEDELLVSIGIRNMIDWAKMDMCVVGEAQNGMDAYRFYLREKPDLILTDIKMPGMDGLQLITKIRENDAKTKIIVLTCYDEFDLVHQALRLGVSDYILKLKMSPREMEGVLQKVCRELKRESMAQTPVQSPTLQPDFAKERILKDYIVYRSCSDEEFEETAGKLKLRIFPARLALCVMRLNDYRNMQKRLDSSHKWMIQKTIQNFTDEVLRKYRRGELIPEEEDRYLLVLSFGDIASESASQALLTEILGRVSAVMKTYINSSVSFGISRKGDRYSDLPRMYGEALNALEQGYYVQDDYCVFYDGQNRRSYLQLLEKLQNFVKQLDGFQEEYREEILHGISQLEKMFGKPKEEIQETLVRWIHWFSANSAVLGNEDSKIALDYASRVRESATFRGAAGVLEKYLAITVQRQSQNAHMSREIFEAVQYIKDNYGREISLQEVAARAEMSPNYFSNLFKKETGAGFTEYVNRYKIQKAKQLFQNTHMKAFEVALKVGFTDESYFSRVFKKVTGQRPNEFRKQPFPPANTGRRVHNVD